MIPIYGHKALILWQASILSQTNVCLKIGAIRPQILWLICDLLVTQDLTLDRHTAYKFGLWCHFVTETVFIDCVLMNFMLKGKPDMWPNILVTQKFTLDSHTAYEFGQWCFFVTETVFIDCVTKVWIPC